MYMQKQINFNYHYQKSMAIERPFNLVTQHKLLYRYFMAALSTDAQVVLHWGGLFADSMHERHA